MFRTILEEAQVAGSLEMKVDAIIISLLVALVLGLIISGVYLIVTPRKDRSANFNMCLIILPAIVAVVVLLIGGNIARAFSMAGIFTLVRFRSIPGDSKDISFVFLTMAVGLAVGLGYLTMGATVAVLLGLAIIIIKKTGFGGSKNREKRLRITIPEDMNYQQVFEELFSKYTTSHELIRVKTTNMGTLFELNYDILMKDSSKEKEFIDAIRCRNGNLTVQLGVKEMTSQQL